LDERPNLRSLGLALAKTSQALAENLDALHELGQIAKKEKPPAATGGDGETSDG
jgi:hypothetical protein